MNAKKSGLSAVGLVALLLAALTVVVAAPAFAEGETQTAAKQILMVFTTDNWGELNPCG
jgi:hypothetical protein